MLKARSITKCYASRGAAVMALEDVSLDIPQGALTVVSGPSGCGKSTLLAVLGLLTRPTSGVLEADGKNVADLSVRDIHNLRRDRFGFLFQDAGLLEPMSVRGNLEQPLIYRHVPRSERARRMTEVLAAVGLADRLDRQVSTLSGGERQRIGLARAILGAPGILICDEPSASLDAANAKDVVALLRNEADRGRAVVCSSHDPLLIEAADRIVRLAHGRLEG